MKKHSKAIAAPASNTAAEPVAGAPADKPRRPRRMVREPGAPPADTPTPAPRGPSKIAGVIALLSRPEGATLAELIQATGWLAHTTRAALTGLKKKGHVIEKSKRGEVTCYSIAGAE